MTPEIPIIDIAPYRTGTEAAKSAVARQFDDACTRVGFMVVTGHGIDPALADTLFATSRQFFDLSEEEKLLVKKEDGASGCGYHPFATQANAYQTGQITPEDLRESFGMGRFDRPGGRFNRWPATQPSLQEAATQYYLAVEQLGFTMASIFARALDLPDDYFLDKINSHDSMMLMHHYPQQDKPPLPGQLRSGQHTDHGLFTMLRMEREHRPGGLQVRNRTDQWVDVPAIADAYTINIGDMLMRWTNDHWISNLHRVINPPLNAGEEGRRISIPFFFAANDDCVVECLPSCHSADDPPKYEAVIAGEFKRSKLKRGYDFAKMKAAGLLEGAR